MIISVIGSGGKTTYIHELKDKYVSQGKTVLMCTTTHMLIEEDTLVNPSLDEIMHQIEKYGYWGLLLFVGIPLPGTGAWTGAGLAVLLNMNKKKSFLYIMLGVILASIIMSIISYGILGNIIK